MDLLPMTRHEPGNHGPTPTLRRCGAGCSTERQRRFCADARDRICRRSTQPPVGAAHDPTFGASRPRARPDVHPSPPNRIIDPTFLPLGRRLDRALPVPAQLPVHGNRLDRPGASIVRRPQPGRNGHVSLSFLGEATGGLCPIRSRRLSAAPVPRASSPRTPWRPVVRAPAPPRSGKLLKQGGHRPTPSATPWAARGPA